MDKIPDLSRFREVIWNNKFLLLSFGKYYLASFCANRWIFRFYKFGACSCSESFANILKVMIQALQMILTYFYGARIFIDNLVQVLLARIHFLFDFSESLASEKFNREKVFFDFLFRAFSPL